jgi:hypothetical protein
LPLKQVDAVSASKAPSFFFFNAEADCQFYRGKKDPDVIELPSRDFKRSFLAWLLPKDAHSARACNSENRNCQLDRHEGVHTYIAGSTEDSFSGCSKFKSALESRVFQSYVAWRMSPGGGNYACRS